MSSDASQLLARPLALAALVAATLAAACMVYYLIRRPPLTTAIKLMLLVGLGLLPILTAGAGNLAGFEVTTTRQFCRGCHVMEPWVADAEDPTSSSLASRHARNALFGDKNCYSCHADYGMYGTIVTKADGLRHVMAYLSEYRTVPVERAVERIHMYAPFKNENCMHCHSASLPIWREVPDHKVLAESTEAVSCASVGCHGPAHPFAAAAQAAAQAAAPAGGAP